MDSVTHPRSAHASKVVLVIDDDAGIADLIEDLLTSEGYAVAILRNRARENVQTAVERVQPDCVLLDGYVRGSYDQSWTVAAWMSARDAAVPAIMFSADRHVTDEARHNASERSRAARFSSFFRSPSISTSF